MVRIVGVEIPDKKRIESALTYIYGIGSVKAREILMSTKVDFNTRTNKLTDDQVSKIQKAIETIPTEGVLRKIVSDNIKRLRHIGSYRGLRHALRLPVRGQRTRTNARTKRGKKMTVGALRKEMMQRNETGNKEQGKT